MSWARLWAMLGGMLGVVMSHARGQAISHAMGYVLDHARAMLSAGYRATNGVDRHQSPHQEREIVAEG